MEKNEIFLEEEMEFPEKDQRRGVRRKKDHSKANRKEKLAKEIFHDADTPNGYFRKGKIHCSCPMCTAKTNAKINKSNGPVDHGHGNRLSVTNHRYGKKNYSVSDMRKVDMLNASDAEKGEHDEDIR